MTALRTQENQLLREKSHFPMLKRCACPVSLTCIHTQQQAMWRRLLEVEALPIDRWHDRTTRTYIYAIDRDRGETWNTSGKPRAVATTLEKKAATTIMHKIKTLFLSRSISIIRRLAQWHDWPRLRASLHTEAQSSLIFRYPMIGTVFWLYA